MMDTPTQLMGMPDGGDGTRETLKLMRDLVRQGKRDPYIRDFAADIIRECPPRDWRCEIETLWMWVANNVRYTMDATDLETLSDASGTIARGYGDCDDMSVLLATLLEATGHRARIVAGGRQYGCYDHVWVEARCGTGWIPVDASEAQRGFGWRPDFQFQMMAHTSG